MNEIKAYQVLNTSFIWVSGKYEKITKGSFYVMTGKEEIVKEKGCEYVKPLFLRIIKKNKGGIASIVFGDELTTMDAANNIKKIMIDGNQVKKTIEQLAKSTLKS